MNLRKDHKALTIKVSEVDMETQMNKKNVKVLEVETQHMKKDIENLFRLSDEFRKEMDELSEQVAELYVLKKQVAEQKDFIEGLAAAFNKYTAETSEYIQQTSQTMGVLQASCDTTQFQLKEMKDYVDHFADNLILNSQQIMVDSYAGFSNRPLTLTEILRMCRGTLDDVAAVDATQTEQIRKAFAELDTKAPDTVLFNITTLEKKVGTIELHIQKEEEQGMGALRKNCEELSVHMQAVQLELAEKIDRESVGFIVHEKYEEIVRYLQDALQSSLEDESNFKQKADEIQEMVILLSNSKADRTEIANMQEIMVKSEALLKKVGAQVNLKDKIKEFVPRKELEAMLANKVDKAEFDQQLSSAVQSSRRNRYQAAVSTSLQPVSDDAMNVYLPRLSEEAAGGAGGALGGGAGGGMSVSVANRPLSGSRKHGKHLAAGGGGGAGGALPSVSQHVHPGPGMGMGKGSAKAAGGGAASGAQGPVSLPLVEVGRLQMPNPMSDSDNEPLPVMAIGQAMHSNAVPLTGSASPTALPADRKGGVEFSSFAKGRSSKAGGRAQGAATAAGGATGTPTGVTYAPGTFSAAAGQHSSGMMMSASTPALQSNNAFNLSQSQSQPQSAHPQQLLPEGYGASEFPYSDSPAYRMNYSEQAALTDHLAYLHGPVVGGGFNAKSAHIVHAMPSGSPVPSEDVEGKGL